MIQTFSFILSVHNVIIITNTVVNWEISYKNWERMMRKDTKFIFIRMSCSIISEYNNIGIFIDLSTVDFNLMCLLQIWVRSFTCTFWFIPVSKTI